MYFKRKNLVHVPIYFLFVGRGAGSEDKDGGYIGVQFTNFRRVGDKGLKRAIISTTLHNVCAVHWGYAVQWGMFSTPGGVQYNGRCSVHQGMFSTLEGYH